MTTVKMEERDITEKILAIVCFGPATTVTGFRPADYYQVTIDPNTSSPTGEYIRFGLYKGDEIQGWQRISAMTIVEVLGESHAQLQDGVELTMEENPMIRMMKVV